MCHYVAGVSLTCPHLLYICVRSIVLYVSLAKARDGKAFCNSILDIFARIPPAQFDVTSKRSRVANVNSMHHLPSLTRACYILCDYVASQVSPERKTSSLHIDTGEMS